MGVELIRFDMSEYMERHTVSRLIGAPPGYVGFDQGGLLTEAVTKNPHAVVLLDEVEKGASGGVQPAAAGHGPRHADRQQRTQGGFPQCHPGDDDQRRRAGNEPRVDRLHAAGSQQRRHGESSSKSFTPEFRNRLDAIIQFAPLDADSIKRVVDKLVVELEAKLGNNNVTLELDDAARDWIAERGYDPKMGARPMAASSRSTSSGRSPKNCCSAALARGGHVRITVGDDDTLKLNAEPAVKELEHLPD